MLKHLVKIKLLGLLGSMSGKSAKAKKGISKGKLVLLAVLYVYILFVFGFMFGSMFSALTAFNTMGIGWMYFACMQL